MLDRGSALLSRGPGRRARGFAGSESVVQAQIVDLLRELQPRHRLAYLFISHDLKVVRAMSDEILVLRAGRVVEQGLTARIFERPEQPYTRALIAAALELEAVESAAT
jgi:microcin C transport system ATP-binding protein